MTNLNISVEEWRIIPGYEHYMASDMGRIKSVKFQRILKQQDCYNTTRKGLKRPKCRQLNLYIGRIPYRLKVHNLVAKCFLSRPSDDPTLTIDHIDRNPFNNNLTNLRWATKKEQFDNSAPRTKNAHVKFTMRNIKSLFSLMQKQGLKAAVEKAGVSEWALKILLKHMHP